MFNHSVEHDGKMVGTRKSSRNYTHAVIGRWSEERARERAYSTYEMDDFDHSNFRRAFLVANATPGVEMTVPSEEIGGLPTKFTFTENDIAYAKERLLESIETYRKRREHEARRYFEKSKARGRFEMRVLGWSQSLQHAVKIADSWRTGCVDIEVVDGWSGCVDIEVVGTHRVGAG
jgi:hypothetical protein